MAELDRHPRDRPRALRQRGREAAARPALRPGAALEPRPGCCGVATVHRCSPADATRRLRRRPLRRAPSREARPTPRSTASLGCGVPTAVADLHEGETVLDLGSGAGADVLISARRVGPTGKAIGLDMTDEMLELARANAARGRRRERRVRQGLHRGDPARRRERRRGDLQLRDQPLRRQAAGDRRGRARAAARRAVRRLRRDRRPGHGRRDPRRHGRVDRLHRRRADPRRVRARRSPPPGFEDIEITRDPPRPRARRARRSSAPASRADAEVTAEPRRPSCSSPQELYRHWEDSSGARSTIDLGADAEQWQASSSGEDRGLDLLGRCPR